ncbi:MAG TPA: LLM class flavin-dependent oxidoreductase [Chitinophaga sp.]|uniref:LLM class flavin-dependent oxidoreductase n=1 Tax=Chitinophaga sp. TaxID=1869181 RepID=UPI002BE57CB1|nr:LLM class flavin-dependent oxidoreductase [Chitinophaga sp.]HVI44836.1 LLM class flavin-dependent oxidoreductase [Chitinophaga sp.]
MKAIKIGLIDFGARYSKYHSVHILNDIIDYAIHADKLGFSRYWMAEHHYLSRAWSNPEMLLPVIAGMTRQINVGVAGILLPAHSPYRIALNFKLLGTLFPGRIDLGIANSAPHKDMMRRLQDHAEESADRQTLFIRKIKELFEYFLREQELFEEDDTLIPPYKGTLPNIWNLGTSLPDHISLNEAPPLHFCKSFFHNRSTLEKETVIINTFRDKYYALTGKDPVLNVAFAGFYTPGKKKQRRYDNGQNRAHAVSFSNYVHNSIEGNADFFYDTLHNYQEKLKVNEFIFLDLSYSFEERRETLNMLSESFSLTPVS